MRQGWPFETTIRAAVGTNLQGLPIGAGLSLGSLAPATTGTSSPQATAQVRMSVNPSCCAAVFADHLTGPASFESICGRTDRNQTQPARRPLDPTTKLLIFTCLSDQSTALDGQQSSGVWVSPRTSVDEEMLCALCYGICTAAGKESQPNISCTQQYGDPLHFHDVRCLPPLQPSRSPSHTTPPSLACPFYPGGGKEAHGTAE